MSPSPSLYFWYWSYAVNAVLIASPGKPANLLIPLIVAGFNPNLNREFSLPVSATPATFDKGSIVASPNQFSGLLAISAVPLPSLTCSLMKYASKRAVGSGAPTVAIALPTFF